MEKLLKAIQEGNLELVRSLIDADATLVKQLEESGGTPLHFAALGGQRDIVQLLCERGADINARDAEFGATPTGWAIEYLRELNGYLSIEIEDLGFAIRQKDITWVRRFLQRFPGIREEYDAQGIPLRQLALDSGSREISRLFGNEDLAG